jgi:hypothetical protein
VKSVAKPRGPDAEKTIRWRGLSESVLFFSADRKPEAIRYAVAVIAAIAALILRKLLNPLLGSDNPYHTAWAAVVFSAWYCGLRPAVVTVVITSVGVWYWFLPPYGSFTIPSTVWILRPERRSRACRFGRKLRLPSEECCRDITPNQAAYLCEIRLESV